MSKRVEGVIIGVREARLGRGINYEAAGALLIPQVVLEPVWPLSFVPN